MGQKNIFQTPRLESLVSNSFYFMKSELSSNSNCFECGKD